MKCVHPDQVDEPNLTCLIQEFIYEQQHPGSSACDIANLPQFYKKITIHTAATPTFHAPSNLSNVGGMKCEHIHAVGHWRKGPGHYDTMFINTSSNNASDNTGDLSVHGVLGLEVARAHLFFSFALDGVKYQCALVHLFSHTTDMPHNVTSMHVIKPDHLPNGWPATAIIHLDTVFRAAHLLPVFSAHPTLSKHQQFEQTLDLFSQFYVNRYINHHAFKVLM